MSEIDKNPNAEREEPEMVVNRHDGAVAVEEADRTVFLTNNETIVVEKPVIRLRDRLLPATTGGGIVPPVHSGEPVPRPARDLASAVRVAA